MPLDLIRCADACGNSAPLKDVEVWGWVFLPIVGRWRCPFCWRALDVMGQGSRPVKRLAVPVLEDPV